MPPVNVGDAHVYLCGGTAHDNGDDIVSERRAQVNRDFVGALLQLNAEKNIPREQLVATLAEAIQSAYRRATPNNENVFVEVDPGVGQASTPTGRCTSSTRSRTR